jgi:hypothetical protein
MSGCRLLDLTLLLLSCLTVRQPLNRATLSRTLGKWLLGEEEQEK